MEFVKGSEKLAAIFEHWPTFHDGEVERFGLEWDEHGLNIRLGIRCWESTGEVDERGYYRLHKHTLVDLFFHGCTELRVKAEEGFLNVVFGLGLEAMDGQSSVSVTLHGIGGIEASFRCLGASVVSATPYEPNDNPV